MLATLEDFEARHGTLAVGVAAQVASLLADATALILNEVGQDPEWNDDGAYAKSVCLSATYRAWSNPDALSQSSMADTSLSYVRGGTPDALWLTEKEKEGLRAAAGGTSVGTITLVSPYTVTDEPWHGDI